MKSHILYLSYDGLTDPLGQSQIIPYLEGLSLKGYQIHIVSFEKSSSLDKSRELISDKLAKAGIRWAPHIYRKSPPIFSTLWNLLQMWQTAKKLHIKNSFRIVHCRSYITSIVGLAMKRRYNTKFLFDMRGFWADERVDGGLWNIKNPIYKIIYSYFKEQEKAFLENADAIISLTHHAKHEINSWLNVAIKAPIHVIPCCVDLDLFHRDLIDSMKLQSKKKELGIESDSFIITYLGAIGTWYMLDEMLEFFKLLLETKRNAKFLFISAEQHIIKQKADNMNIPKENIIVYKAERNEVPLLLSLAQLSIFFIKPAYSKKASSPTKQGELMAMGIPIICNSGIGDTDKIIKKYDAGNIIDKFNFESYKIAIERIEQTLSLNKDPIVFGAHQVYSLANGIANYSHVYHQLISHERFT